MQITEVVQAERRSEQRGKNHAGRLRRSGRVPAVLYGAKQETVPVSVDPRQITRILHSEAGHNAIFDVEVGGERTKAMIVAWQWEPIKGALLHIDMKRIAMDERIRVRVPIELKGEPVGVKQQGGILDHILREVELECLPGDIPGHLEMDISELVFGQVLRVADLPHSEKLTFITDAHAPVAHIVHVKEEAPAAAVEAGVEAAPAPAEPEVIRKGKAEAEEEEEAGE